MHRGSFALTTRAYATPRRASVATALGGPQRHRVAEKDVSLSPCLCGCKHDVVPRSELGFSLPRAQYSMKPELTATERGTEKDVSVSPCLCGCKHDVVQPEG